MQNASVYASEDYHRIARAIAFMRQHHLNQPNLATVAQHIGLSEYHFQRLFTQWAGISPKRFLQYLTVEYAKSKITQTKSLLDLTLDVRLSSPGRLHDLFVNLEAMSPGEFKAGGAGLQIRYGIHDTPFGTSLIATTARGICNLYFLDTADEQTAEKTLRLTWKNAEIIRDEQATQSLRDLIFNSETFSEQKPLTLLVKGTNFQIQVWRALLQLPFGAIATYQTIAQMVARPTAARAVGNAIGKNPIGYLIPCHRVIRESGEVGGYGWGVERKTVMLGWEASQTISATTLAGIERSNGVNHPPQTTSAPNT
ncbi:MULTISPECIES: bifunctional helix-turn-helix domain-containing protein/methylated-DNA--[protein]-cysteine S-methyltransferase [unclassified Microcoleus]|uniref:bifunctional helix-turn-helix domain-containing protein/methylated-DNA--[protein]-cysteine S-methyltransferase n=1 Tax=unclassified Microcoleus TaxID=2642155 RepID=UPI002FD129F3